MNKSKVYIPVSVKDEGLPPENNANEGYTIDVLAYGSKTSLPIRGCFGIHTKKFFPLHYPVAGHNYITHWLQPVERYVLDEAEMQNILSDKDHHDLLIECCNKIIDGTDKGNIPGRHLAGLKILLGRPNKK